ncbi:hypothetical protein D3C74_357100 [compost metagenome]
MIDKLFYGDADASLLYFSGHGSENGHLVTPDYRGKDLGVLMSEVLGCANKSRCKNKIIILDCCYSGKFSESPVVSSNESILGEGVTIMTASSRDEVATESNGQGLFTRFERKCSRYSWEDYASRYICIYRSIIRCMATAILRRLGQYFDSPSSEFKLDPSFEFTNNPDFKHEIIEPFSSVENVNVFKELQLFESVGLVEPVDEEHMYFHLSTFQAPFHF